MRELTVSERQQISAGESSFCLALIPTAGVALKGFMHCYFTNTPYRAPMPVIASVAACSLIGGCLEYTYREEYQIGSVSGGIAGMVGLMAFHLDHI